MKTYGYCFLAVAIILFGMAILQIAQKDYASAVVSILYCFVTFGFYKSSKLYDKICDKLKEEKDKLNHIYSSAKEAEEKGLSLIINTKGENTIVISAGKEVEEDEEGGEE